MKDSYLHQGLRKQLIDQLRGKGVDDPHVLAALLQVPRHYFMDSAFLTFAYEDKAFPIGSGQTISQPYTVAIQTMLLQVSPGMKVLEIGTGSGYQTAVLQTMGCKVYSIERHKPLYKKAQLLLSQMNLRAQLFYGDGYKGLPAFAPFDRILVTCGAPELPKQLLHQLKPSGSMVIPLDSGEGQEMLRITKKADDQLEESRHGRFRFVPMLGHRQS